MSNPNITISAIYDGISSGTIKVPPHTPIDNVYIKHDRSGGKNLIEVKVDGEVVFRYDSTKSGQIVNHIQEEGK